MYSVSVTNSFKKNFKLCQKKNYDLSLFDEVLSLLIENGELTKKFKPHILKGNYKNYWECHIKPDWLLIWWQDSVLKEIILIRTGLHFDLF